MTYKLLDRPESHFQNADNQYGKRTESCPDFNYNLSLGQLAVEHLTQNYTELLQDVIDNGLLKPPIPRIWRHETIRRIGRKIDEMESDALQDARYTSEQFENFNDLLRPRLAKIWLPRLVIGADCYLGKDGFVVSVEPRKEVDEIDAHIQLVTGRKVGKVDKRHTTLFYTAREASDEELDEIERRLQDNPIDPVEVDVDHVAAIEQYTVNETHYEWKVIEDIPLANAK
jgi:hypothetical protein